jgi:hypothetical protein
MDKFLLLLGFQFTQGVLLLSLDTSTWQAIATQGFVAWLEGIDVSAPDVVFDALLSGTWIGRLSDVANFAALLVRDAGGLPLLFIAGQVVVISGYFWLERRMLARTLRRHVPTLPPSTE